MSRELLRDVLFALARRGSPAALIGAVALAAHGIARATLSLDLLSLDHGLLADGSWRELSEAGTIVEVRCGDAEDPLAGVVRLTRPGQIPVDVVVGKQAFLGDVLARRRELPFDGGALPIVDAPDLVVLEVFAGGPQDLLDAGLLLSGDEGSAIRAELEGRLPSLPKRLQRAVRRLLARHGPEA